MKIQNTKSIKYHKLINTCISKLNKLGYEFIMNETNNSGRITTSIRKTEEGKNE